MADYWTLARRGRSPAEAYSKRQRRMGRQPLQEPHCEAFESPAALAESLWLDESNVEEENPASFWEVVQIEAQPRQKTKRAKQRDGVVVKCETIVQRTPLLPWIKSLLESADPEVAKAARFAWLTYEDGCFLRGEDPEVAPPLLTDPPDEPSYPFPYYGAEPTVWHGDQLHFRILFKGFFGLDRATSIESSISGWVSFWCTVPNRRFEWQGQFLEVWLKPTEGVTWRLLSEMRAVWTDLHQDPELGPIEQVETLDVDPADDDWTRWSLKKFPNPKRPKKT